MNCSNCGAPIKDGAAFCPNCGTRQTPAAATPPHPEFADDQRTQYAYDAPAPPSSPTPPPSPQPSYTPPPSSPTPPPFGAPYGTGAMPTGVPGVPGGPKPKSKKKLVLILVAIGVVVIAAVLLLWFFVFANKSGASDPEEVLDNYFAAYEEGDVDALKECYPEAYLDAAAEAAGYDDELDEYLQIMVSMSKNGTIEYEILDEEPYSKSELEDLNDEFRDEIGIEFTDAIEYKVSYDFEMLGEKETYEVPFIVVEMDGKWYRIEEL